jgi:predicted MFS family arabinose efflux permease
MTLCAGALIASEFLPVSLLTPVASDLQLSEGQAGQAISISGIFAVLTSLFVSAAVGRLDRRLVLLGFSLLMVASGTVVAFAPNFLVPTIGRALLGVAIGGFWSMSTSVVMRIAPMLWRRRLQRRSAASSAPSSAGAAPSSASCPWR